MRSFSLHNAALRTLRCVRRVQALISRCAEYGRICLSTLVGFLVLGFTGFFVKVSVKASCAVTQGENERDSRMHLLRRLVPLQ